MNDNKQNNVIQFGKAKIIKDVETALEPIEPFREFYTNNHEVLHYVTDFTLNRLIKEFDINPADIKFADYCLMFESIAGLVCRTKGIRHPLAHEVADDIFGNEKP